MRTLDTVTAPAPPPVAARARVLVIEDESLFARAVAKSLDAASFDVACAATLAGGRQAMQAAAPDLVLLDLRLPDGNGMDFLAELATLGEDRPQVLVLTAYGEIGDAVQAIKLGAADYLKKPIDLDELRLVVERVLATTQMRNQLDYSRERDSHVAVEGALLIGESPPIQRLRDQIHRLARLGGGAGEPPPTVLILGETGSGKDVAARLLHLTGPFRDQPFVQVDCASLPRDLMEAELFGHEKGAFTSAVGARAGPARGRGERHHFSRRDRRAAARPAGEAPERDRAPAHAAHRQREGASDPGAHHGGHQPRSAGDDCRRRLPRRSVLPPERDHFDGAAAARARCETSSPSRAISPCRPRAATGCPPTASAPPPWKR